MSVAVFSLVFVLIAIVSIVAFVWSLVKIVQSDERDFVQGNKLIWVLVVVFAGLLGTIVWYFVDWKQRPATG